VPAARIEELDLSDATRIRDEAGPADVEAVEAVQGRLLARLGALV